MNGTESRYETGTHDPRGAERPPAPEAPRAPQSWSGQRGPFDPRRKSPILACFLSFLPGLGQVYVGYYRQGFLNILIFASAMSILVNSDGPEGPFLPIVLIFVPFFMLYNVVDAGRRAALYNQAMEGSEAPRLPVELPQGGMPGSLLAGFVLIAGGFVLLLHTNWGITLDWVEDWWPVAPMLFGAYLVWGWLADRRRTADAAAAATSHAAE
jgi:hypothetical protein